MKTAAWHIPFYTRQCRAAAFTENETGLDSVRDRLYYIRSIEHLRPARNTLVSWAYSVTGPYQQSLQKPL